MKKKIQNLITYKIYNIYIYIYIYNITFSFSVKLLTT
jgi:hypothetical protein